MTIEDRVTLAFDEPRPPPLHPQPFTSDRGAVDEYLS
jgi:hypothetical protein